MQLQDHSIDPPVVTLELGSSSLRVEEYGSRAIAIIRHVSMSLIIRAHFGFGVRHAFLDMGIRKSLQADESVY